MSCHLDKKQCRYFNTKICVVCFLISLRLKSSVAASLKSSFFDLYFRFFTGLYNCVWINVILLLFLLYLMHLHFFRSKQKVLTGRCVTFILTYLWSNWLKPFRYYGRFLHSNRFGFSFFPTFNDSYFEKICCPQLVNTGFYCWRRSTFDQSICHFAKDNIESIIQSWFLNLL